MDGAINRNKSNSAQVAAILQFFYFLVNLAILAAATIVNLYNNTVSYFSRIFNRNFLIVVVSSLLLWYLGAILTYDGDIILEGLDKAYCVTANLREFILAIIEDFAIITEKLSCFYNLNISWTRNLITAPAELIVESGYLPDLGLSLGNLVKAILEETALFLLDPIGRAFDFNNIYSAYDIVLENIFNVLSYICTDLEPFWDYLDNILTNTELGYAINNFLNAALSLVQTALKLLVFLERPNLDITFNYICEGTVNVGNFLDDFIFDTVQLFIPIEIIGQVGDSFNIFCIISRSICVVLDTLFMFVDVLFRIDQILLSDYPLSELKIEPIFDSIDDLAVCIGNFFSIFNQCLGDFIKNIILFLKQILVFEIGAFRGDDVKFKDVLKSYYDVVGITSYGAKLKNHYYPGSTKHVKNQNQQTSFACIFGTLFNGFQVDCLISFGDLAASILRILSLPLQFLQRIIDFNWSIFNPNNGYILKGSNRNQFTNLLVDNISFITDQIFVTLDYFGHFLGCIPSMEPFGDFFIQLVYIMDDILDDLLEFVVLLLEFVIQFFVATFGSFLNKPFGLTLGDHLQIFGSILLDIYALIRDLFFNFVKFLIDDVLFGTFSKLGVWDKYPKKWPKPSFTQCIVDFGDCVCWFTSALLNDVLGEIQKFINDILRFLKSKDRVKIKIECNKVSGNKRSFIEDGKQLFNMLDVAKYNESLIENNQNMTARQRNILGVLSNLKLSYVESEDNIVDENGETLHHIDYKKFFSDNFSKGYGICPYIFNQYGKSNFEDYNERVIYISCMSLAIKGIYDKIDIDNSIDITIYTNFETLLPFCLDLFFSIKHVITIEFKNAMIKIFDPDLIHSTPEADYNRYYEIETGNKLLNSYWNFYLNRLALFINNNILIFENDILYENPVNFLNNTMNTTYIHSFSQLSDIKLFTLPKLLISIFTRLIQSLSTVYDIDKNYTDYVNYFEDLKEDIDVFPIDEILFDTTTTNEIGSLSKRGVANYTLINNTNSSITMNYTIVSNITDYNTTYNSIIYPEKAFYKNYTKSHNSSRKHTQFKSILNNFYTDKLAKLNNTMTQKIIEREEFKTKLKSGFTYYYNKMYYGPDYAEEVLLNQTNLNSNYAVNKGRYKLDCEWLDIVAERMIFLIKRCIDKLAANSSDSLKKIDQEYDKMIKNYLKSKNKKLQANISKSLSQIDNYDNKNYLEFKNKIGRYSKVDNIFIQDEFYDVNKTTEEYINSMMNIYNNEMKQLNNYAVENLISLDQQAAGEKFTKSIFDIMDNLMKLFGYTPGSNGFINDLLSFFLNTNIDLYSEDRGFLWYALFPFYCRVPANVDCENAMGLKEGIKITFLIVSISYIIINLFFPTLSGIYMMILNASFVSLFLGVSFFYSFPGCVPQVPECAIREIYELVSFLKEPCLVWPDGLVENGSCPPCGERTFKTCSSLGFYTGFDSVVFLAKWLAPNASEEFINSSLFQQLIQLTESTNFLSFLDAVINRWNFTQNPPTDAEKFCFFYTLPLIGQVSIVFIGTGFTILGSAAIITLLAFLLWNAIQSLITLIDKIGMAQEEIVKNEMSEFEDD